MTRSDAPFGSEAREFFEHQQAARRERQQQARREAAEEDTESRHDPDRDATHTGASGATSMGEPEATETPEPRETPTREPDTTETPEPRETATGEAPTLLHERPDAEPGTAQPSSSHQPGTVVRSQYVFRVLAGDEAGKRFALAYGATTVGRKPGSGMLLDDPLVSHVHAIIETTPDRVTIRDKNSTNGTLVNGVEISETTELQPGDTVLIGDVLLRLEPAGTES